MAHAKAAARSSPLTQLSHDGAGEAHGRAGLVAPGARFDPQGNVAAYVKEVLAVRDRTDGFLGAQLVFCDLSLPKGGKALSVYDDLKQRLLDAGCRFRRASR